MVALHQAEELSSFIESLPDKELIVFCQDFERTPVDAAWKYFDAHIVSYLYDPLGPSSRYPVDSFARPLDMARYEGYCRWKNNVEAKKDENI